MAEAEGGGQAGTTRPTRCGFVALIGAPNVGKSTLVNALVGAKVTIVSRKVQTTRARIRGIAEGRDSQSPNRHPDIGNIDQLLDRRPGDVQGAK